jgi:hypothetical protein
MKWIEVWVWDSSSQSFFPSMELVPKSEEEIEHELFADKVCTWFWTSIAAILGVAAIVTIVGFATL